MVRAETGLDSSSDQEPASIRTRPFGLVRRHQSGSYERTSSEHTDPIRG